MKTRHMIIASLLGAASTPYTAHAQTVKYQTSNVTIYELDAMPTPRAVATPTAPQAIAQTSPAPTSSTSVDDAPDATGWLGALWSGRANIGASLQTGNTEQNAINGDASIKAKWEENGEVKHRASLKADINRETEDSNTTEDNRSIDAAYDYFLNKKWFIDSTLGFEQDDIDQLDLRTTAGIGIGHQAFESDNLNLQYTLGPTYLRDEYKNGDTDDSIAARWALEYDQTIWNDMLQLFHEHKLLIPVDDTENFLFDSKSGIRVPLKKGLVATAEIDFDWDNAPETGVKEDDTTYALKIGYEW